MRRTFHNPGGKAAAASRHAERPGWLTERVAPTLSWLELGGDDASRWRVEAMIVVDAEVPSAFIAPLMVPVVDVWTLAERLARSGRTGAANGVT